MKPMENQPTNQRILVVDDDVYNRDFYKELLADAGFTIETAANGDECIARLQSDAPYNLILLDVVMPVKDGLETLKEIQGKEYRAKHGQIYMLSALGQDSVLSQSKEYGSNGYIIKTDITPEQLVMKITAILNEHENTSKPS